MLLRFGVENFGSIKKYQEVSLVASKLKDNPAFLLTNSAIKDSVLPVVSIYGANASGKSNLLSALHFLRFFILSSFKNESPEEGIFINQFMLDPAYFDTPSQFDCDFIINEVRYHFGFKLSRKMVVEEWLYAYPSGTRQVWYHRNVNDANVFYFGKFLKGKNKSIEELTRNECLFISSAYHNNHEQLSVVYEYFRNNFVFKLDTEFANPILLVDYFKDDTIRNQIVKFLSIADFGITDAKIVQMPGQEEMKPFLDELHSVINKFIGSDSALPKRDLLSRVSLGHRNLSGETVFLDFNLESRGTAALISILGPAFKALSKGKVIIVDELDTSMHSLLSRKLLELFSLAQTNTGGAQIIFTTHDTNLLLNRILRRDEIWFTEKDNEGATHIFPLTDIRTRNGDNLEKGYLQGRFGAIPFLGPINGIFDVEVEE